jgi:serine/threonine protein kinase
MPEVLQGLPYNKSVDLYLFGLLAYELMVGEPAFSSEQEDLEDCILKQKYKLPNCLSNDAKDLIKKLLVSQPDKRLTISQIKKHCFFNKINWKQVLDG